MGATPERLFPVGSRVRLSTAGRQTWASTRWLPERQGIVVGYGRDGDTVRVRWAGIQTVERWRVAMLERDDDDGGRRSSVSGLTRLSPTGASTG